jgi:arylsulfatase A
MKPSTLVRILLSPLLVVTCCLLTQGADMKPNIILLMADDMGMGDTSAFQDFTGNADNVQLHTPQMERLARMGVRFTDAHTPSSRCTATRYGLLTGRYPWRSRLKCWVLFGSQGDPLIEADRPTIATMLHEAGYATGMVGKWHVGLRYRQSNGKPAAGWEDADLTQPLFTTPLDHGFDFARFTSRSHGTSGPNAAHKNPTKRNNPNQSAGPGHIHGRIAIGATSNGKQLVTEGSKAYILKQLGSRHSDHALEFLNAHIKDKPTSTRPFFLYYPSNSNHGPYTPDRKIGDELVAGAARTKSGTPMDVRHNYIYENDVALGRLIDWLAATPDPRQEGSKLISNTLLIFTSDNGAEKNSDIATGPFRSHKGSCYEGGHRVPFIACWPAGRVGDGNASTPGKTNTSSIGLTDMYATFAEIAGSQLPDLARGEKGAEDSLSILDAMRGARLEGRPPLFFNDHKEAREDPAAVAIRAENWKIFFDASLLREGKARPVELYNLAVDKQEEKNLVNDPNSQATIRSLTDMALNYRRTATRLVNQARGSRVMFDWRVDAQDGPSDSLPENDPRPTLSITRKGLNMTIKAKGEQDAGISPNPRGLGVSGGKLGQVESGEVLEIVFDRDVIVESVGIVAGNGTCGGFYQMGQSAPLAIYCVDADNDAKAQQGVISDLGVLPAGQALRLDSSPHHGVEAAGSWRLETLTVRVLASKQP